MSFSTLQQLSLEHPATGSERVPLSAAIQAKGVKSLTVCTPRLILIQKMTVACLDLELSRV
jgi:hypothetical protein